MTIIRSHLQGVFALYRRHFWAFLPDLSTYLAGHVLTPLAFLLAFGYGLGSFIELMGGLDYFVYVLAGTLVYKTMFAASLETAMIGYTRFFQPGIYSQVLTTPLGLTAIVWAEILWGMSKALLTGITLMVFGFWFYDMPVTWHAGLLALGLALLFCFTFSATALVFVAYARSFEFFAYFFAFWVYPAMFFGGVFYDLDNLPTWAMYAAQFHPVTQAIAVIRPILGDLYLDPWEFTARAGYVLLFGLAMAWWARAKLKQRLFN